MRKLLFPLVISLLLFSCTSTGDFVPPHSALDVKIEENISVEEEKEEVSDPVFSGEVEIAAEPEKETAETEEEKEESAIAEQVEEISVNDDSVKEEVPSEEAPKSVKEEDVAESPSVAEAEEADITGNDVSQIGLDSKADEIMLTSFIMAAVMVLIVSLSTIIRSNSTRRMPVLISIVLALLFTAIPMMASVIISGWNNLYYAYLVLLLTFFIIRGKKN